ncbi:MAG: hypothetical protein GY778_27285 [bacterium]|nr:hypothetical protein [bacterium]
MNRRTKYLRRLILLLPMTALYNIGNCQTVVTRDSDGRVTVQADELEEEKNLDLGDYLADLVEGL